MIHFCYGHNVCEIKAENTVNRHKNQEYPQRFSSDFGSLVSDICRQSKMENIGNTLFTWTGDFSVSDANSVSLLKQHHTRQNNKTLPVRATWIFYSWDSSIFCSRLFIFWSAKTLFEVWWEGWFCIWRWAMLLWTLQFLCYGNMKNTTETIVKVIKFLIN